MYANDPRLFLEPVYSVDALKMLSAPFCLGVVVTLLIQLLLSTICAPLLVVSVNLTTQSYPMFSTAVCSLFFKLLFFLVSNSA